jgi:hypothetical protein
MICGSRLPCAARLAASCSSAMTSGGIRLGRCAVATPEFSTPSRICQVWTSSGVRSQQSEVRSPVAADSVSRRARGGRRGSRQANGGARSIGQLFTPPATDRVFGPRELFKGPKGGNRRDNIQKSGQDSQNHTRPRVLSLFGANLLAIGFAQKKVSGTLKRSKLPHLLRLESSRHLFLGKARRRGSFIGCRLL